MSRFVLNSFIYLLLYGIFFFQNLFGNSVVLSNLRGWRRFGRLTREPTERNGIWNALYIKPFSSTGVAFVWRICHFFFIFRHRPKMKIRVKRKEILQSPGIREHNIFRLTRIRAVRDFICIVLYVRVYVFTKTVFFSCVWGKRKCACIKKKKKKRLRRKRNVPRNIFPVR